jgi:WD40 repeat protein
MRHDEVVPECGSGSVGIGLKQGRVGSPRFSCWTRCRIVVLLSAALGLPWLSTLVGPTPSLPMQRAPGHFGAQARTFALSPDGQTIAMANSVGLVTLRRADRGWDIDRSLHICGLALAFSPDGRTLVVGGLERDIVTLDLVDDGPERSLAIPVREISDVKFSPDGQTLALSSRRSCDILLWDVQAGRERMTLRGHSSTVVMIAFAPDGRSLASTESGALTVLVWDLDTGQVRHRLAGHGALSLAYSPDGCQLATVDRRGTAVRIWDAQTGELRQTIGYETLLIRGAVFSPDGRLLAMTASDGTVVLWSLATGREVKRLDGQVDILKHVAFLPDGRTLAATSNDDDIRLWDLNTLVPGTAEP